MIADRLCAATPHTCTPAKAVPARERAQRAFEGLGPAISGLSPSGPPQCAADPQGIAAGLERYVRLLAMWAARGARWNRDLTR